MERIEMIIRGVSWGVLMTGVLYIIVSRYLLKVYVKVGWRKLVLWGKKVWRGEKKNRLEDLKNMEEDWDWRKEDWREWEMEEEVIKKLGKAKRVEEVYEILEGNERRVEKILEEKDKQIARMRREIELKNIYIFLKREMILIIMLLWIPIRVIRELIKRKGEYKLEVEKGLIIIDESKIMSTIKIYLRPLGRDVEPEWYKERKEKGILKWILCGTGIIIIGIIRWILRIYRWGWGEGVMWMRELYIVGGIVIIIVILFKIIEGMINMKGLIRGKGGKGLKRVVRILGIITRVMGGIAGVEIVGSKMEIWDVLKEMGGEEKEGMRYKEKINMLLIYLGRRGMSGKRVIRELGKEVTKGGEGSKWNRKKSKMKECSRRKYIKSEDKRRGNRKYEKGDGN